MIALPRTHVKLPCRHGSLSDTVVRTGSEGLNYPELVRNYPMLGFSNRTVVRPSVLQWFEQVQMVWTTPISCETTLWAWFPQSCSGSSRFWRIELPRTLEKLPYRPGFLSQPVVRTGSAELNYPELFRNYHAGNVYSVLQWFEQVQKG